MTCWCALQFSRAALPSGYEECNLDLSGRFSDGGPPLPKLVHVCTQTSISDMETSDVRVSVRVDRATSTEGHLLYYSNNNNQRISVAIQCGYAVSFISSFENEPFM